jgi:hypothetical protein
MDGQPLTHAVRTRLLKAICWIVGHDWPWSSEGACLRCGEPMPKDRTILKGP